METQIWCPIARKVCEEGKLTISYPQSLEQSKASYKYTINYVCKAWEDGACLLYQFLKYLNTAMEEKNDKKDN